MRRPAVVHFTSAQPVFDFRMFHKECKSLVKAGCSVMLVAPHDRDEVVEGVRIKAVPKSKGRLARMTLTAWRAYREAVRLGGDLYLFPDPELIPAGLLLRLRAKKVVYDIRELGGLEFLTKDYLPVWARGFCGRLVRRLQAFALPRLSAALSATPSIVAQFPESAKHKLTVVQNFPSPAELSPRDRLPWDQRPNWAVYVGGITTFRGIREMLNAMSLLPESLGVSLRIAGAFAPRRLRDEVSQIPGWQRTEYMGILDRPDLWKLLGQARLGLLTLHPSPAHYEAWPAKLFEYMCAGVPVIASDFPLWREIVEGAGCGLLVDPLDPGAIAKAMEFVLTHPAEATAMGRHGREAVEHHYNWETEEKKLLKLYACLLHTEVSVSATPRPHRAGRADTSLGTESSGAGTKTSPSRA